MMKLNNNMSIGNDYANINKSRCYIRGDLKKTDSEKNLQSSIIFGYVMEITLCIGSETWPQYKSFSNMNYSRHVENMAYLYQFNHKKQKKLFWVITNSRCNGYYDLYLVSNTSRKGVKLRIFLPPSSLHLWSFSYAWNMRFSTC